MECFNITTFDKFSMPLTFSNFEAPAFGTLVENSPFIGITSPFSVLAMLHCWPIYKHKLAQPSDRHTHSTLSERAHNVLSDMTTFVYTEQYIARIALCKRKSEARV